MTSTPIVQPSLGGDRKAGPDPVTAVHDLLGLGDMTDAVGRVTIAETAITDAISRYPHAADRLFHSFPLLVSTHELMDRNDHLYAGHCHELVERVAAGRDTRPGTAAEICIAMTHISMVAPLTTSAAGLFMRAWRQARMPDDDGITAEADHHEAVRSSLINRHEQAARRRLTNRKRRLSRIACDGVHYGETVHCRYASAATRTP